MPDVLALMQGAVDQPRPQTFFCTVSTNQPAPASHTDPLYVLVPWATDYYWMIPATDWVKCHGATLPAQGASCLVFHDRLNPPKCIWWAGVYS